MKDDLFPSISIFFLRLLTCHNSEVSSLQSSDSPTTAILLKGVTHFRFKGPVLTL